MSHFFPKSRGIFGSLVANLNIEKFLKFIELILVRVFLDGNLMVIGRYRVSRGSKGYQYCYGYAQCLSAGRLLLRGISYNGDFLCHVTKMWQLRLVRISSFRVLLIYFLIFIQIKASVKVSMFFVF